MIHVFEHQGTLYISREGRLTSVHTSGHRSAIRRMLKRLHQEGQVRRYDEARSFLEAHQGERRILV